MIFFSRAPTKLVVLFVFPIPQAVDQIRACHITLSAQVAIDPEKFIFRSFAGHD